MPVSSNNPRRWRRLAKLPLFLARGAAPGTARWLAQHDAAWKENFQRAALRDLEAAWAATGGWGDLAIDNGQVISRSLNLPLGAESLGASGYAAFRLLAQRGFSLEQRSNFVAASNRALQLRITNVEELEMLREIFLEGCYDLRLPGRWVVLDVGANVGFASLHFASQSWVERVFAFEPFGPTAAGFAANVALNPALAAKIALESCGWSDHDGRITVDYDRERSGSIRTDVPSAAGNRPAENPVSVPIQLTRASAMLDRLASELAGRRVLLKLDCEGSEFPILRDLEASAWLPRIDAVVMEWHYQPPDELIARLQRAGFALQVRPVKEAETQGILFAWRQNAVA